MFVHLRWGTRNTLGRLSCPTPARGSTLSAGVTLRRVGDCQVTESPAAYPAGLRSHRGPSVEFPAHLADSSGRNSSLSLFTLYRVLVCVGEHVSFAGILSPSRPFLEEGAFSSEELTGQQGPSF